MEIVFLHGWGQHSGVWRELLAALQYKAHLFGLPGHGAQAWQAPYFELDELVDIYAAQAPERCCVVGWSLGGMIALRWAQRHPRQVEKLVGIGTTPCFGQRPDWPYGAPADVQANFSAQVVANPILALNTFADLMAVGESNPRKTGRRLRELIVAAPIPSPPALQAGLEFLAKTDMRDNLAAYTPQQPTLLLHGEDDAIVPLAASQWLATLPNARLTVLSQCGHAPMVSRPEEIAANMKKFFNE